MQPKRFFKGIKVITISQNEPRRALSSLNETATIHQPISCRRLFSFFFLFQSPLPYSLSVPKEKRFPEVLLSSLSSCSLSLLRYKTTDEELSDDRLYAALTDARARGI